MLPESIKSIQNLLIYQQSHYFNSKILVNLNKGKTHPKPL